jgi:hypothetical protein
MIINPYIFNSYDPDALAFITATGITETTQKNAINQLVLDFKNYSLWSKMNAIYPFIGGNPTSPRYNLKAPTTNTSDFYLTPVGGITYSSQGVTFNGTTGYYNTNLTPSSTLTLNDTHFSVYNNTDVVSYSADMIDLGVQNASSTNRIYIESCSQGNNVFMINTADGANFVSTSDTDSLGLYINNRVNSTTVNAFKNNTKIIANTTKNSSSLSTLPIFIGAFNNNGTAYGYSSRTMAFATIGKSLSDSEASALYAAIQTFNTTLARNI